MPNVGQRGGCPSDRSNTSIGKFDSIPPSTMYETSSLPSASRLVKRTGS